MEQAREMMGDESYQMAVDAIQKVDQELLRQTASAVILNSQGNTSSDNGIIKLGASGMQDKRLSTLSLAAFNNNMF